ncbi:MAG TPA: hypothetical protein DIT01_04575 [Lentisphaeria bacterium]|nr:hypothetical protein [Lentisphaeria bacterium]|tara:strand:+ start:3145 stop:4611 length:1467 start_codon:yes stop_codon:yes gene_type:complete
MIEIAGGVPTMQVETAVLFAFDDTCLPFRRNLRMHLIHGKSRIHGEPGAEKTPIVLANGPPGAHDEEVQYYGTTIRIGDELRMWYMGRIHGDTVAVNYVGESGRLCYAVSRDGVHWEKPALGLVDYKGSKANNLVDFPQDEDISAGPVIYDPEDPDPSRRFKINYEAGCYGNRMCVAYSPDGLHWTPSPRNPVGPRLEQSGLIRWNGCYYVNGQGGGHPGRFRQMLTYASYDFEHWSEATVLSLQRSPLIEGPSTEDRTRTGEEVHLGAALHARGNVILGIYGQWHGEPAGDRRYVTMDLGLLISHDAMHFREPIPGFRFIPAREELDSTIGYGPALMQGQGMANMGDLSLYWYALWRHDGQVRLATWERDRFGYVTPDDPREEARLISCPVCADNGETRVFLNVSGLGEYAMVRVELLDLEFRPLAGYSGADAALVRESGLRVPVQWGGQNALPATGQPLRLAVALGPVGPDCPRPEDIRIHALYVN